MGFWNKIPPCSILVKYWYGGQILFTFTETGKKYGLYCAPMTLILSDGCGEPSERPPRGLYARVCDI